MAFTDAFTGTAGAKLKDRSGWVKIGPGWDPFSPEINASNQIRAWTDTSDVAIYGQDAGSANHYVQARVYSGFPKTGGAAYSMLCVRATGRSDAYGAVYNGGSWCIYKNNGSNMASVVAAFTAGSLLRLEAEGTQIRLLVDGVIVVTFTDSEKGANTKVGMIAAGAPGSDPVFDDYESGQLVTAPPATGTFSTRTINGQDVTYTFTTTNTPTSGTMTLTPTSGGAQQGPANLTLGPGTASITFTGVVPGTYTESGTITGAGGGGAITGLGTLTISSISGNPPDTGEPQASTVSGVSVSPSTATGSTTFSATVNGTNSPSQAVTWSATAGSIDSAGVFTAPAQTGSVQTITVTATSVQDNTKSGQATVTIAQAPAATVTSVTVSPSTATGSATFSAVVNGTNSPSQAVTWTATGGSITAGGVFTAPGATNSDQVITVRATSVFDPTKYGAATVTIAAVPNVVPPSFVSVKKGRCRRKGRR